MKVFCTPTAPPSTYSIQTNNGKVGPASNIDLSGLIQLDEKRAIRGIATASVFLGTHHPLSRIYYWTST
jgi:hypothetical protein